MARQSTTIKKTMARQSATKKTSLFDSIKNRLALFGFGVIVIIIVLILIRLNHKSKPEPENNQLVALTTTPPPLDFSSLAPQI